MNSAAHTAIVDRIRKTPEYKYCRTCLLEACLVQTKGASAFALKNLGGFTSIINEVLDLTKYLPGAQKDFGSKLIPMTVVDVLRQEISTLREELQLATVKSNAAE